MNISKQLFTIRHKFVRFENKFALKILRHKRHRYSIVAEDLAGKIYLFLQRVKR